MSRIPEPVRNAVFKKYGKKCRHCGWKPRDGRVDGNKRILSIHHLDSNPHNNRIENLIILCNGKGSCHSFAELIIRRHKGECGCHGKR